MNKITGEELAFPIAGPTPKGFADQPGMTLRQYYVGQALAGLCANPKLIGEIEHNPTEIAKYAEEMADLAILELNTEK